MIMHFNLDGTKFSGMVLKIKSTLYYPGLVTVEVIGPWPFCVEPPNGRRTVTLSRKYEVSGELAEIRSKP